MLTEHAPLVLTGRTLADRGQWRLPLRREWRLLGNGVIEKSNLVL